MWNSSKNEAIQRIKFDTASVIAGYIDTIKNRYRVNINFHDVVGMSKIDNEIKNTLKPYSYHNNYYCNYIKKNNKNFCTCTLSKSKLCEFFREKDTPIYGQCYMGIEEYVFPVKYKNKLIAFICVGQFFENEVKSMDKIRESAKNYGLNPSECIERFFTVSRLNNLDITSFAYDMGILTQYISLLFVSYIQDKKVKTGSINQNTFEKGYIVEKTINMINENYSKDLSLDILASNCYCNPSYLSHVFKEKRGISVSEFINTVRIDEAKMLLDYSKKQITEIALECGFNDSTYFSRVFKKMTGCSPLEYKERKP